MKNVISMDLSKVQTVLDWKTPSSGRDIQLLRNCKFLPQVHPKLFKIVMSLIELTKKSRLFQWSVGAATTFNSLKKAFTSVPILIHVDLSKPFIIEVDVSDFVLGSILSQSCYDRKLLPISFHSRKFESTEINYEIHNKEFLAIVDSFEQRSHLLEGSPHKVTIFNDYKSLTYSQTAQVLSRRKALGHNFYLVLIS